MLSIRLFGPTAVMTDGGDTPVTDLGGVKPRQILEILAARPGAPVTKDRLAELLWDGEPATSYVGTLESYVCVLRRKLGHGRGRTSPLTTTSNGYLLDPATASVDLAEFRRLVRLAATAAPANGLQLVQQAVAMLSGELLASEAYQAWACSERKVFQRDVVEACCRAAQNALAVRDFDSAECMSRLAIGYDCLAEDAWQHLMRALSASGRGCEAIRAYVDLRTAVERAGVVLGPLTEHGALAVPGRGRDDHNPGLWCHETLDQPVPLHVARQGLRRAQTPVVDLRIHGVAGCGDVARLGHSDAGHTPPASRPG